MADAQVLYSPMGKVALMNGTSLTEAFVALPGGGAAVYNGSGLQYYRAARFAAFACLMAVSFPIFCA